MRLAFVPTRLLVLGVRVLRRVPIGDAWLQKAAWELVLRSIEADVVAEAKGWPVAPVPGLQ